MQNSGLKPARKTGVTTDFTKLNNYFVVVGLLLKG